MPPPAWRRHGETHHGHVPSTPAALALIAELTAEYGPILFHQSGGCCDGSSPMCYPQGDSSSATATCSWARSAARRSISARAQFEVWRHTQLIIDVVAGRGGMFSLDNGRERRFLTRSTICAVTPDLSEAAKQGRR